MKVKILLVDDSPAKLLALKTILGDLSENLVEARSGEEALGHLLRQEFAVILLDINMPGMDGFETAALIRQRGRSAHTPIIFVSAMNTAETDLARGYSLGAVDYILTPIVPESLRAKVAVFVALFKKAHEVKRQAEQLAALTAHLEGANRELQQAKKAADRASQAKSEFLSRMSHELRTPLNAILGFGQLLEMDALNPEQREGVGHILKAGRHLLELINEVLDIARIEANRLAISLEPVPLNDVVQETLDLITPLAVEADVQIHAEAAGTSNWHILADRQRLKQVLLNLLANAVKYNRKGGFVAVSYEESQEGRLRVKVTDTGPGIPAERIERLFTPFERLGAEQTGIEGTGLGLALSKRLTEAMGGTLGVESTVGRGSTFWVEFALVEAPVQRLERTGKHVPAPAELEASKKARVVLYVEDNLSNIKLIQRLLAHRPEVRLLPAMQGLMGLDLAREHRPHLILLDLQLPDIPGDEVLLRLREAPETSEIPVVVISADATPGQIERLLAAGARAYLTKPLDVKKLLDLLDEILKEREPGHAGRNA